MPALDRKWWTLIAVCTATFMLLLDITVVNVALPDIQSSLHASFSDLQWVVDAYSLTLAAFLLTAGVVGDIYGRREVFAAGLVIFSVSSLVCGLSTDPLMLNLARAVQGVGGAIMFATSLALIASAFVGRDRGTAFGIYGAVIGGAVAIGPLIGGAITSGIGWRRRPMMATNTIRNPADGPFAATLVNSTRAIAEPVGVWMVQLIIRWRGGMHFNRLVDQTFRHPFRAIQGQSSMLDNTPLRSLNGKGAPGALDAFVRAIREQATVLTLSDSFVIIAGLAVALMIVLMILPERTYPPRIALAMK